MIRHVLNSGEMKLVSNANDKTAEQLNRLNSDLNVLATGKAKSVGLLDEAVFLPTGPRAYAGKMTVYQQKWLEKLRETHHNIFIGKEYFDSAPEYAEASEIDDAEEMSSDEVQQITETIVDSDGNERVAIKDDYDPNNSQEIDDSDELSESEKNVMDFSIIKTKVSEMLDWEIDDLFGDIVDSLNELHADDENYTIPENLREVVEVMQTNERLNQIEYKKNVENMDNGLHIEN